MNETDPGRHIALVILGVYVGVAATLVVIRYNKDQDRIFRHLHDGDTRLHALEFPQPETQPDDDAPQS